MTAQPVVEHTHYFRKVSGVWTCDCSAMADRYGKVVDSPTEQDLMLLID